MSGATHYRLVCPYCGEKTKDGHFVPPSFGEEGFTICAHVNRREQEAGMPKKRDWTADPTSQSSAVQQGDR